MADEGRLSIGNVGRLALTGVGRRWPWIVAVIAIWIGIDLARAWATEELLRRQRLEELAIGGWIIERIVAVFVAGAIGILVIDGLRQTKSAPLTLAGTVIRALPTLLLLELVFSGPGHLGQHLAAGQPMMVLLSSLGAIAYQLVLWPFLGMACLLAIDGHAAPTSAVRTALALGKGRRWLLAGLFFGLTVAIFLLTVAIILPSAMGSGGANPLPFRILKYLSGALSALVVSGIYLELRRLYDIQAPGTVADTFD